MEHVVRRWTEDGWAAEWQHEEWVILTRDQEMVAVRTLDTVVPADTLRAFFQSQPSVPLLILVERSLIPEDEFEADEYLLALHALYYGRVYAYSESDETLWAVHFERLEGSRRRPDWRKVEAATWDFLTTDTDCLLAWFPGTFSIARFYDRAWWTKPQEPPRRERVAQEGRQRQQRVHAEPPPSTFQKQPAWVVLGVSMHATPSEVRAAYRRLAKLWHPDLNRAPEATERMQAINAAYEMMLRMH